MKIGTPAKNELDVITAAIQQIAKGELDVSLDDPNEPELQSLAIAVRQMAKNLNEEFRKALSLGVSLRNLAESIPIGLIKWSSRGEILFANQAALRLWDFRDWSELQSGTQIQDLFSRPNELKRLMQDVVDNGVVTEFELATRRQNGEQGLVSCAVAVVKGEDGGITGFVGAVRDISNQREMEVQLIQMEKLESINSFATGLAHDLNNILCGILPNLEMLRRHLIQGSPESGRTDKALRLLDSMDRSAQCGVTLAKQLMSFSRKNHSNMVIVDLNTILMECLHRLEQSLGSGIRIETDLSPQLWNIEGDPSQLEEILIHLGKNAQQAMRGVGVLRVTAQNVTLDASSPVRPRKAEPGDYVQLVVSDTGRGIDPEKLNRIFDPFFDMDGMNQEMGLALSMVFGMVKNHNGFIDVESGPHVGTAFKIHFPRTRKAPATAPHLESTSIRRPERILVVDDEALVREATVEILSELGYEVNAAQDGDEALNRINQREDYDLVILDIQMPRLNGHETLTRLREVRPDLKVLLTSGHCPPESVQDLLQRHQCGFLQKPYRLADISRMVRTVLDGTNFPDETSL